MKILVVDDDPSLREMCVALLRREGFAAEALDDCSRALKTIETDTDIGVILSDLKMPGLDGMALLRQVRAMTPTREVVMITGHASVEGAVEAMRAGAVDYLVKPFGRDKLFAAVERGLRIHNLENEVHRLRGELFERYHFENIIGKGASMRALFEQMARACKTESTVLLTGESGTGKELVARAIHYNSSRSRGPFVPVNCAALPKELMESELFGHHKGSFTGAVRDAVGLFRAAEGGTIFLDEIAEVPLAAQAKLLRVLQEHRIRPVGGTDEVAVDVRVLAATNVPIVEARDKGLVREDLYYRLTVLTLALPPLRERREDIALLARFFIERFNRGSLRKVKGITLEAVDVLARYDWPGNVRELENAVEYAFAMGRTDEILPRDLPRSIVGQSEKRKEKAIPFFPLVTLKEAERLLLVRSLRESGGNKARAARLLGISRKRFYRKIEEAARPSGGHADEAAAPDEDGTKPRNPD